MPEYSEFPFNAYLEERSKINDKQQAQNAQIPNIVGNLVTGAAEGAISTLADKAAAKKAKIAQITDTLQENYDYIPFDDKGNRGTTPDPEGATEAIQGLTNDGHHIAKQADGSVIYADTNKKQLGVFVLKAKPSSDAAKSVRQYGGAGKAPMTDEQIMAQAQKVAQKAVADHKATYNNLYAIGKGTDWDIYRKAKRDVDNFDPKKPSATIETSKKIVQQHDQLYNITFDPNAEQTATQAFYKQLKNPNAKQPAPSQPQATPGQSAQTQTPQTPAQVIAARKAQGNLNPKIQTKIQQLRQSGMPDSQIAAALKEKGVNPSLYGLQTQ